MKMRAGFLALAFAAVLAAPVSAQSKLKAETHADGVWAAQPEKGANVGWFLFGDGVVAVDSGGDTDTGKQILAQIAETTGGKPVRALVLTHAHGDHGGGARAFAAAGARVLCQEGIAGQVLALLTQPGTDPADPLAGKPNLRPVVEAISERSMLLDGLHNVQIYFLGAAHTKGDLIVYLAVDKILFAGDLALNGRLPYMQSPDVDAAGWERALATIARVAPEKMVPGHGDIGPVSGIADSLVYVRHVSMLAKKFADNAIPDERIAVEIRAPENTIKNVPISDAHIANVQAAVNAVRAKARMKPTPAPAPAPTPAAK
jgi:glyoxylase-like metal-dependent hydrolase (beta-lactamase superfamily II)